MLLKLANQDKNSGKLHVSRKNTVNWTTANVLDLSRDLHEILNNVYDAWQL